jgi:hypothetical protein
MAVMQSAYEGVCANAYKWSNDASHDLSCSARPANESLVNGTQLQRVNRSTAYGYHVMAESSHMHAIVELDQCRVAVLPFTAGSRLATPDVYSKACQMLSAPPADLEELLVESGILRVATAEEAA